MKWRACSKGLWYDRGEGRSVYFDPASGDTHLLDEFAAHILQQLSLKSLSESELQQQCEPALADLSTDEQEQFLEQLLLELASLDLVEVF
ncbi:MAG: HPr-rel-A system PqqD family peptide chaperone [Porticoccaceae bacterium]|nr:HPr-rel-A system PqqD family peptide chaperone [Pseudomonadales bacterium]MCP5172701.1 HPr-rel-A system PqqD family peptide chaperone [Pseudomonadales bacterium]MCP5302175.1 HPr-rel-A system PqqD family peptide chaperone [Pseudomonadales bacterium]